MQQLHCADGSELKEGQHCQATAASAMPAPCSEVRDLLVSTKLKAVLHEHKTVVVLKDSATVEQALTVCSRAQSATHALCIACQGHGQCNVNYLQHRHWSSHHTLAQVLAGNRILSAPVVAPSAGSGSGPGSSEPNAAFQEIVCFLDLRDVLCSFLEELDMEKIREMKMLRRMKVCAHT